MGGVGSAAAEVTGATRSSEARPVRPARQRPDPQGWEAGGGARGWGAGGFMGTGRQCGETRTFWTGRRHSNVSHRVPRSRTLKNGENGDFDLMRISLQINFFFFFRRGRMEGKRKGRKEGRRRKESWVGGAAGRAPTGGGRGGRDALGPPASAPRAAPSVMTGRRLRSRRTSAHHASCPQTSPPRPQDPLPPPGAVSRPFAK